MSELLTIQHFGPIQEAEIEIRPLTLFVGPQAAGKSTAAQLLYFMRGLEALTTHSLERSSNQERYGIGVKESQSTYQDVRLETVIDALEWWLGNAVSVYTTLGTMLQWNPQWPNQETRYEVHRDDQGIKLSDAMGNRMLKSSSPPSQVYIPAGRALYSFLPPAAALRFFSFDRLKMQWPGYIVMFYETLGYAINQIGHWGEIRPGALDGWEFDPDFIQAQMNAVMKGRIRYGADTVWLTVDQQIFRPETIAAGQMEMWPFWTILEQVLYSGYLNKTRIYFEEPEAHLHPGAQRSVMEVIAYLVRRGCQFVITTHSPYILYAVNTFLLAQQVLDQGGHLPSGMSQEIALGSDQVAAYRFSPEGRVYNLMDAEVRLIDEDELDRVADDLGSAFTRLQQSLDGIA